MQSRSATSRRLLLAASASSLVFGCAPLPREPAVPPDDEAEVTVLGLKNIRYWGDEDTPEMIATGKDAYERELAAWRPPAMTDRCRRQTFWPCPVVAKTAPSAQVCCADGARPASARNSNW